MLEVLQQVERRLAADGIETEYVVRVGEAIAAHVDGDRAPWFTVLETYVRAVRARPDVSLWSVLHYVVPPLLPVVGQDVAAFARLLQAAAAAFVVREDSRFEQQGVAAALHALPGRPESALVVLQAAQALLAEDLDAGWLVQLVVPALARAQPDDASFAAHWRAVLGFAQRVNRGGVHVGYPLSTGLAALLERVDAAHLPRWLEVLEPLAITARRAAYGLFEHAIPALAAGELDAEQVHAALRLALTMLDHGLAPGPTLSELYQPLQLELATRLADAGVDPALVIGNGVRHFARLGWLDDDGERLYHVAVELHRRGLRQLLFQDGLDVLHEFATVGQALAAWQLVEAMVARDLEPGVVMRWSLPRTLPFLRPDWALGETLAFARALVEHGIAPESGVQWAVRPLVEAADGPETFRRTSRAVVATMVRLRELRGDVAELLVHDFAKLAETGQSAQGFLDLLALFDGLLAAWSAHGLDVQPLLARGIPAAAQAAQGRPWVLAAALTAAVRLSTERRHDEALALLCSGVGTAVAMGADDADGCARALALVEARFAELPMAITGPASAAAAAVAGADVQRLGEVLATIAAASQRHGPALEAVAAALPDLARMATPLAQFAALLDLAVELGAREPALVDLAAIAAASCEDGATAQRTLRALAQAVGEEPARRRSLAWFARCARVVEPAGLAAALGHVHDALADCREHQLLLDMLARARDGAELLRMTELLPPLIATANPALLNGLACAKELLARYSFAWCRLIAPVLVTAKERAGSLLWSLRCLPGERVASDADGEVLQQIVTQFGVKAVDVLESLVAPALRSGVIGSLAEHAESLPRYLREVGFADADVYARYLAIVAEAPPARAADDVAALRREVATLTAAIRTGEVTSAQRQHALFGVALQRVFPPAASVTRRDYERLVDTLPDRPHDVAALFGAGVAAPLEVLAGAWQLGAERDGLEVFGWCAEVLPEANATAEPFVDLGWQLLTAWSEDRLARPAVKRAMTRALLAHLPAATLPEAAYGSAGQIMAIRALAADRLLALVEQALLAARADDSARCDRLICSKLAPPARVGPGMSKAVANLLQAVARGALEPALAEQRLRAQLQAFALPEDLLAQLQADPTLLQRLPTRPVELEPGKEVGRVHAELVGQELAAMNATIARALEYRPSSEVLRLEAVVTKRAVHAPIGYCTGVCVAPDQQLWANPRFVHLALFQGEVCRGGVHLLVLEDSGRRYLALPGINPASALLEQVEAAALLTVLLEHCKGLARQAGLDGVWVPTSRGIHSNRAAIGEALERLALPVRQTQGHTFSYSPYAYRIDAVWEF